MKLESYSIDDLHAMATAELEQHADAVAELQRLYGRLRDEYIAVYRKLQEKAAS